jgi:NTP pyrophosphatase (non-canonical NTP hydrolase)
MRLDDVIQHALEKQIAEFRETKIPGPGASLTELRHEAYKNAAAHGFHDSKRSLGDSFMLISSEVHEAYEAFREGAEIRETRYECSHCGAVTPPPLEENAHSLERPIAPTCCSKESAVNKPIGIPSEIADLIIRCLDFAGEYDIDIERIVLEKMAFNRTRPPMHGKRI